MMEIPEIWEPSYFGKLFSTGPKWRIALSDKTFLIEVDGQIFRASPTSLKTISINNGIIWSTIIFSTRKTRNIKLRGLPNEQAHDLLSAREKAIKDYEHDQRMAMLGTQLKKLKSWHDDVEAELSIHQREGRFINWDTRTKMIDSRPELPELASHLRTPLLEKYLAQQEIDFQPCIKFWKVDIDVLIGGHNHQLHRSHYKPDKSKPPKQCPICGGGLRIRKRGSDSRQFLGCSRYPGCRYTFNFPKNAPEEKG